MVLKKMQIDDKQGGSKNLIEYPGSNFFISLGFAEPTNHVIETHVYIK